MKKLLYTIIAIVLCIYPVTLWYGCNDKEKEVESLGSIFGMVSEAGSAEPMRGTGVELYYLNEEGTAGALLFRTTTADDGSYSFDDVKAGEYLLRVEIPGYKRTEYRVVVESGRSARADMQVIAKGEGDEETDEVYIIKAANLMVQKKDLGTGKYFFTDASALSKGSIVSGYTDWRLPTYDELMIMYNNKDLIGGFEEDYYMSQTTTGSSDRFGTPYYYIVSFSGGSSSTTAEFKYGYVRAVRSMNDQTPSQEPDSSIDIGGLMIELDDYTLPFGTLREAQQAVKQSRLDGYNDWRLPTSEELSYLYANRTLIGNFATDTGIYGVCLYWSSSIHEVKESYTTDAGVVVPAGNYPIFWDFSDGNEYFTWSNLDEVRLRVRAVRTSDKIKNSLKSDSVFDFPTIHPLPLVYKK